MGSGFPRRVVIAGVATHWGTELARALERRDECEAVIGIDTRPPGEGELERTEFVEADIRNPVIGRILPAMKPDVVVHCGIVWYPEPGKPARALHDINVIGTLHLLAACEKVKGLRAIVARGSAAIYGSEPSAPAFHREDAIEERNLQTKFQHDIRELESYFSGFARRHRHITSCMLRFQPEIGPDLNSPLVRYLRLPVVPTQLGFDPMLQLLHSDDATGALMAAVANPVDGAVNVAPTGAVSLTRTLRLAGRPTVPIPHQVAATVLAGPSRRLLGAADLHDDGIRLLRYGRGCDNTRLLRDVGYEPIYTAEGAVEDFVAKSHGRSVVTTPHPGVIARRLGPTTTPNREQDRGPVREAGL